LRLLASLHGFSNAEMFEARLILEMAIAGLAAERATSDHIAAMAEELAEMFATLDVPEEYLVHDMRFHQMIAAASGNRIITALMNMVASILFDVRSKTVHRAHDLKESADMHRLIFRAIREGNTEAARGAMRDHLLLAQRAQSEELAESFNAPRNGSGGNGQREIAKPKTRKTKKTTSRL
jgi:GntR family transcriptional repressor for pyruvate dehydrogenase complex